MMSPRAKTSVGLASKHPSHHTQPGKPAGSDGSVRTFLELVNSKQQQFRDADDLAQGNLNANGEAEVVSSLIRAQGRHVEE